jgi:hypothetical protein
MDHKSIVNRKIGIGLAIMATLGTATFVLLPNFPESTRIRVVAASALIAAIPLFQAIGSVILRRYADSDFILGYQSKRPVGLDQAILQNTLEQSVITQITVISIGFLSPAPWIKLSMAQSICFLVGRQLYVVGYKKDAISRLYGFVIGWYAALCSFVASIIFIVRSL